MATMTRSPSTSSSRAEMRPAGEGVARRIGEEVVADLLPPLRSHTCPPPLADQAPRSVVIARRPLPTAAPPTTLVEVNQHDDDTGAPPSHPHLLPPPPIHPSSFPSTSHPSTPTPAVRRPTWPIRRRHRCPTWPVRWGHRQGSESRWCGSGRTHCSRSAGPPRTPPSPSSSSTSSSLRAGGRMRPSGRVRGTWWLLGKEPRPVAEGVCFDDLVFVPDSDDKGAGNEFNSQGCDDEFVPETQQDVPIKEIGIGHPVTSKSGGPRQLGVHPRLGTMLHDWLQAISEYEKPSIDMATIEKAWADEKKAIANADYEGNPSKVNTSSEKKACVDEGKSISDAETDDEGVGMPEKKACIAEGKLISDAETDDEGVGVPRNLQMKDLHDIMSPTCLM
ncbi:uncharacterized protein LOC127780354 [Oryza glaberrima]|uniref:uncharacterized protein LOC127780354 n=1 Tax=Oryza glaberrima TaxID=4538 RepID=UPI00224C1FF8|nr:uncharacterized protein LOC127780354 [Oryza glaberrima]